MKKYFLIICISLFLLFPGITQAKVSQNIIQKKMVLARYEVTKDYGDKIHSKLDPYFIKILLRKDKKTLEKNISLLKAYFQKRGNLKNLTKKEDIYLYMYIRSYYELHYRMK